MPSVEFLSGLGRRKGRSYERIGEVGLQIFKTPFAGNAVTIDEDNLIAVTLLSIRFAIMTMVKAGASAASGWAKPGRPPRNSDKAKSRPKP